jgi:hypothetical protein
MTKVYLSKIAVVTPTREKSLDLRIADIRPLWIGEQSLESIDVWWVLLYFLIAAITIPIVIFLGPIAIRNYVLESDYDDATGKTNVIYRIRSLLHSAVQSLSSLSRRYSASLALRPQLNVGFVHFSTGQS